MTRAPFRSAGSGPRGSVSLSLGNGRRPFRGLLARLRRDEDGVALVLSLAVMSVLALTTTALLLSSVVNQQGAYRSAQERQAFWLAQAAVAYAEGTVYNAPKTGKAPPRGPQQLPAQAARGLGTATYSAASGDGKAWTIVGTGTVGGVTRTIQVQAWVPTDNTFVEHNIWNYLYADDASKQGSLSQCETTLGGSVKVSVPIFVRDNLCISGSASFSGSSLEVGGNLILSGSGKVGTKGSPVDQVFVGGTPSSTACTDLWHGASAPGSGWCDGQHDSIYATTIGPTLDMTPGLPPVDWQKAYDDQAALAKSGCPAGLLDNDSTLNDSAGTINLMPPWWSGATTGYDCVVGPNEITWQPTKGSANGTLTVQGTLYFDGSFALGGSSHVLYQGQATLYFTGGVHIGSSAELCGISNCTTAWDPDTNGIIFVARCWANSTGSALLDPDCALIDGSARAQVGVYATRNYHIGGSAVNMGPVLANTLTLQGSSSTLIPFKKNLPPGTPLANQPEHAPQAPNSWAG